MDYYTITFFFFLRFRLLKRDVFIQYLKRKFTVVKKTLLFLVLGYSFISCSEKAKIQPPAILPITFAGNNTVLVSDNFVTLLYNEDSNLNGFSLIFQDVGDLECDSVSLTTTTPYGFVPKNEIFKPYFESCLSSDCGSKWQYTCTKSDNNITLTEGPPRYHDGFRPWADNFNITIGTTTFTVNVLTDIAFSSKQLLRRGTFTDMVLSSAFKGCGLYGTILQRVFDCSKKVINYAVYVDPVQSVWSASAALPSSNGTSAYYTLFSPALNNVYEHYADPYWFVAACPNSYGISSTPQQQCAWLTPIVTNDNPAIEKSGFYYQTFGYDMLSGYQKRFLMGGMLDNNGATFSFEQANGFSVSNAQNYYTFLGFGTPTSPPALGVYPSVCSALIGNFLYNSTAIFLKTDQEVRDLISYNSGASVSWKVPSYPMLNTLTGGTATTTSLTPLNGGCSPPIGGPWVAPYCNVTNTGDAYFYSTGFNAINVPGFISSDDLDNRNILWSSSMSTTLFSGNTLGYVFNAVMYYNNTPDYSSGYTSVFSGPAAVRCSSLSWY